MHPKTETDAIFAIKQVPDSFKELEKDKENDIEIYVEKDEEEVKKEKARTKKVNHLIRDLAILKKDYEENIEVINKKDFDIFGGLIEDKTKIKTLNNEKHREIEKDKYKVLNINLGTDLKLYTENLESYLKLIREALNKIKSPYNMSAYCIGTKKNLKGLNILSINPKDAFEGELLSKKNKITLCKIDIKENAPLLFYSNIIFYDNFNKTLPLGMNLSSDVLIDADKLNLKFSKEESFYINYKIDEFDYGTKEIVVYEYEMQE